MHCLPRNERGADGVRGSETRVSPRQLSVHVMFKVRPGWPDALVKHYREGTVRKYELPETSIEPIYSDYHKSTRRIVIVSPKQPAQQRD